MALQKQLARLDLTGGLQKKDDEFLVIPSKLLAATNVEFDDASTVRTRDGLESVSLTSAIAAITVARAERLFTHQNIPYIESRGAAIGSLPGGVHRVNPAGGTVPVGNPTVVSGHSSPYRFRRAGMVTKRISSIDTKGSAAGAGSPYYEGSYDHASVDGVAYYASESRDVSTGRVTVRVSAVNESTGFRYFDQYLTDSTNILVKPRVVVSSGKGVYVYFGAYASGATQFAVKMVAVTTAGAGVVTTVLTSASTGGNIEQTANDAVLFDCAYSADGNRLGLVVRDATAAGTTILFRSLSTSDGFTISASGTGAASARITSLATITSNDGSNYRIHAFYGIGTAVAKGIYYDIGVGSSGETTVGTAASGNVGRLTAFENSATQIFLAFDSVTSPGGVLVSSLRLSRFTHSYGSLTECASSSPWVIAGRLAQVQSRIYLPLGFLSSFNQSTIFVVDASDAFANLGVSGSAGAPWQVLARIDYGECVFDYSLWTAVLRVPNLSVATDDRTLYFAYLKYETDLRLAGTTNDTARCLARAAIDLGSQLGYEEINGITFLAGACPYIFDGSNMVEENFHHGPEIDVVAALGASGYQLPNATQSYTVCFTYAWQDAQGNWHESAPSNERTFAVTGGSGNYFIPASAVILPPTQKANARVLMYRTKALGTDTALYLASKSDGSFITTDADLDDGEQLYTAGNVLPNTPAPACRQVSTFDKRLVLSGCGDGQRMFWSKQVTPGYGVEFSSGDPTHQQQVPQEVGRVVASEEMDGRLIVVCESAVGVIGGQGPSSTGLAGQYSDFATIIPELGGSWDSPRGVVRGPEGVWFRAPVGIRLVSRSGGIAVGRDGKQVGADVDSEVSGTVVAVAGENTKQQIRFYTQASTALVWDSQWGQWTKFTQHANVDACFTGGSFYHLSNYNTSTPLLRKSSGTRYYDTSDAAASAAITSTITTAWLAFAGIQGFERLYRLMILGTTSDTGGNWLFDLSSLCNFSSSDSGDGGQATIAAANGTFQFQHHFARQKVESMKLTLSWYSDDHEASVGRVRLSNLTLQFGVKNGYFKMPSSSRF